MNRRNFLRGLIAVPAIIAGYKTGKMPDPTKADTDELYPWQREAVEKIRNGSMVIRGN